MVKTTETEAQVDDLFIYVEASTQTEVSFTVSNIYDNFITNNKDLFRIHKKISFSNKLRDLMRNKEDMNFIRNKNMKNMLTYQQNRDDNPVDYMQDEEDEDSIQRRITEILKNYAFEAKEKIELKYLKDNLAKENEMFELNCMRFKNALKDLDVKYSK